MNLDFTFTKYSELCHALSTLKVPIITMAQFLKLGQPKSRLIILRHDVDRSLTNARRMAFLEAEYKIVSTYYFRTTNSVYKPEVIKEIHALGHEVGYHYEVLATTSGDHERAIELFQAELRRFRSIVAIETISMHGSPLLPWDNRDLWQKYNFLAFDLLGEAYLSICYDDVHYFTDTGRSWSADRYNIRDRVSSKPTSKLVQTTDDLITFLREAPDRPCIINTHPHRWSASLWSWGVSLATDFCVNQVKVVVNKFYDLQKDIIQPTS
jgi:hypothetical protein